MKKPSPKVILHGFFIVTGTYVNSNENAVNDSLKELHQMVNVVKHDREVSLNYMKSFERDQMLIKQGLSQGLEQGREQERANTERERLRAEHAEKELALLKKQLDNLTLSSEHS